MAFRMKKGRPEPEPTGSMKALASLSENEVFARVRQAVVPLLPDDAARARALPGASLLELGIDSLKVVELSLALEDTFQEPVFLPDWIGTVEQPQDLTLGSLAGYIHKLLQRK